MLRRPPSPVSFALYLAPLSSCPFKCGEPGFTRGCNATSAPEQAAASALSIRVPSLETASRELISSAHEITSALNKNNAQSASMIAAPDENFDFAFTRSTSERCSAERNDCFPRRCGISADNRQ